jgi:hypothetical protein
MLPQTLRLVSVNLGKTAIKGFTTGCFSALGRPATLRRRWGDILRFGSPRLRWHAEFLLSGA